MKPNKKIIKIVGIVLGVVLAIFILNAIYLNVSYMIQQTNYQDAFSIYGNTEEYVPQGLTYSPKYNVAIQTSYNAKHQVSRIYVIDLDKQMLLKSLKLQDPNGNENTHHVGGIATNDEVLWITNDYEVEEYSLEEIVSTKVDHIKAKRVFDLPIRGDFCSYYNNQLWIGDFYLRPFYNVPNGNPLLMAFPVEEEMQYSVPSVVISLPKMIQGLAFNERGELAFTASYTYLIPSTFYLYPNVLEETAPSTITVSGKEIPYYPFDKKKIITKKSLPPMAEGMYYLDGSYYILFESSSDHYSMAFPKIKKVIQYKTDK